MTIRTELLAQASAVHDLSAELLTFLGSPAFWACASAERVLLLEQASVLHRLEAIYLARAELHAAPELDTDARRAAGEEHERELREARERTYRASNLCPDCKGAGNRYCLTLADDVPREVFSEGTGACRRCGGSGRYVRLGVSS